MAKTHTTPDVTHAQDETKQQREKQAKREAKLMLKLEGAKKDVRKAEKRVTKAQANLETSTAQLRDLEQKLAAHQGTHATEAEPSQTQAEVEEGGNTILEDTGDQYDTATPADQSASLPPVEGREDVGVGQNGTPEALQEVPHPITELEAIAEGRGVVDHARVSDATSSQEEPTSETTTDGPNRAARRASRRSPQE